MLSGVSVESVPPVTGSEAVRHPGSHTHTHRAVGVCVRTPEKTHMREHENMQPHERKQPRNLCAVSLHHCADPLKIRDI